MEQMVQMPAAKKRAKTALAKRTGAAIRKLRRQRGLSLVQLGSAPGLSFQQVHKYEVGLHQISLSLFVAFCQTLDVAPGVLLEEILRPGTAAEINGSLKAIGASPIHADVPT